MPNCCGELFGCCKIHLVDEEAGADAGSITTRSGGRLSSMHKTSHGRVVL